nr:retrovirus-related Pol polyprotein from transposon TNT 1-94 [Tanacetum cinerariifolium]
MKDCDYHAKKMAQPTPRNHAHKGNHKQYAPLTHTNPQKHMVPTAVLTQSKPISITAVRPVSTAVPKIKVTRPRHANSIITKSKLPIRRHITRSLSPKTNNSPLRVTAVKALVVSAAQGMKGRWGTCHIYLILRSLMVDMFPLEVTPRVVRFIEKEKFRMKGIKMEFSIPRTPQQNDIAERKNKTFIEAARTMLVDSLLPILFWAEAVNTACYVQNMVLVTKPHNKTPYELLHGRTPSSGPTWLFDIDSLTRTMNYQPVTVGNQTNRSAGFHDKFDAEKAGEEIDQQYVLFPVWSSGSTNPQNNDEDAAFDGKEHDFDAKKPESEVSVSPSSSVYTNTFSAASPSNAAASLTYEKSSFIDASQLPDDPDMPDLEDITYSDDENDVRAEADFNNLETSITVNPIPTTRVHKDHPVSQIIGAIGTKWVYRNKKDERGIVIRNKARLIAQGHTHEEGIDYEEVFAPVARIKAIRLFLAYASFMDFMMFQMDVKSAFLYGTIKEEFTFVNL